MAVFKCKMCGRNLEVSPGMSLHFFSNLAIFSLKCYTRKNEQGSSCGELRGSVNSFDPYNLIWVMPT